MHCVSNTIVIHFAPIAYAFSALCHTGTHKLCSPPCLLYFRSRSPFLLPLPSSFTTAICFGHLVLISLATTGCSAQPHPCLQRSVSLSLSLPPFFNGGGCLPCCPRILLLLLYSPPPSNNLLFRSVLFISNFWGEILPLLYSFYLPVPFQVNKPDETIRLPENKVRFLPFQEYLWSYHTTRHRSRYRYCPAQWSLTATE